MLEDVLFEHFLHNVREFHAGMRKQLDAIVVVRVVRCRDDDAGLIVILTHKTGYARRGDHAGKSDGRTSRAEAGGEQCGDVRAGFARVRAQQDASRWMLLPEIRAESATRRIEGGVVERWCSGNAANSVCAEQFFRHE